MEKEKVKNMLCDAINNIPESAEITDCYIEHSYGDCKAYIKVAVEVKEKSDKNILEFNSIAHNAFDTNMGIIS